MRTIPCSALILSAFAMLTPTAGNAQTPTAAFDGTYIGTSATFAGTRGGKTSGCNHMRAPYPVTIVNGHAQGKWTAEQELRGDVDAQGRLVMHTNMAARFDGQIDAGGTLRGTYNGYCTYELTWQRRR